MEIIRGLHNLQASHKNCVATIGNFDGVHRGHQFVFKQLKQKALALNLSTTLIIFEPHPKEYFSTDKVPTRLTRLREKLSLLNQIGIDRVLVIRFNEKFAKLTAEAFIQKIIVEGLQIKYLIVGDDFRFGYQRQGDLQLLKQFAMDYHFEVVTAPTQIYNDERISSSRIRQALQQDNLTLAEQLLGRPYGMCGRVAHGDKRGRSIGFPTANIYLHRKVSAIKGVYAVKVYGLNSEPLYGVCNLGNRPTVDGTKTLLEVHIFNFSEQIYGRYVQVDFLHKLRDEQKYPSFDALKEQIFKDAEAAKEFFNIV